MLSFGSTINVTLIGRIGKDPAVRDLGTSGNKVVSFSVAVDKYNPKAENKRETLWIEVQSFQEKDVENFPKYLAKGAVVSVTGEPGIRTWEDKEGKTRVEFNVRADRVVKVSKDEKAEDAPAGSASAAAAPASKPAASTDPDDDIPF